MMKILAYSLRCMIALLFVMLSCASLDAQIVYSTNFEDAAERELWHLNEGPRANLCNNKWYFGEAGNATREGNSGLFISNDGTNAEYSSQYNENVIAYREMTFPEGDYVIYFNWRGKAQAASADGVWCCWVPDSVATITSRTLRAGFIDTYRCDTVCNNSTLWQQSKMFFHSDGKPHKLVFAWTNAQSANNPGPSGCVDDIEILPVQNMCPAPAKFQKVIKGTTMVVSWQGNADWYDARVLDVSSNTWQYFDNITIPRLEIEGLSEGMTQIFVRAHCGDGFSEYALYNGFFFLPGKCINYLAIDDKSQCLTYIGTATAPKGITALVDSGFTSMKSRHTLHYIPGETDPRTNNMLKTKPDDALASVRLGNWNVGAEGEAIEYYYHVPDGESAILKLRYAIVLNQPNPPHSEEEQSSFSIDIRYTTGNGRQTKPLDNGCGAASFHIGYGDQTGWHPVNDGTIMWKEWDEVAVNLRDYVGKTVIVTLSTADCTASGHYSYAYFTLDCESGELSGLNCGEDNPTTEVSAPDGFDYRWYLPETPDDIISTDQTFYIPEQDTMTYFVDVISLSKSKCYYTLSACGIPRYPVAKGHYKHEVINCQNVITFYNDSYIYYHNKWREIAEQQHYTLSERPEEVTWDFGDGNVLTTSADSIVYVYPKGKMDITPKVTAAIAKGQCTDTFVFPTIHLDDESIPEKDVYLSVGSYYQGKFYFEPYDFDVLIDNDGCEELLHVHVVNIETQVDTSFCEGGYYQLGEQKITQSVSNYRATLQSKAMQDPYGNPLDSIVILNLHVEPQLKVELDTDIVNCADNRVFDFPYTVLQGQMDTIVVRFDEKGQKAGFKAEYGFGAYEPIHIEVPQEIKTGDYNMTIDMGTPECPVPAINLTIHNDYSSLIIDEKGPFLVVYDSAYNGGYNFTSYQWYKNGELMQGETNSYIVLSESGDSGNEYYVVLVAEGDTTARKSCPVVYQGYSDIRSGLDNISSDQLAYPTLVRQNARVYVNTDERYVVYDILGKEILRGDATQQSFAAPQEKGVYLIYFEKKNKVVKFVVR
ncbi:MAG: hypothetical protein IKN91_08920 [Paludibacteraceae bacterium]|nr:hypothetical protein [Paludibacteraceae bacterium]